MTIGSSSLMRWRAKKLEILAELPDYSLLFYHHVGKWEDDNKTTHGDAPKENSDRDDIFYIYPLNFPATPDVIYTQAPDITPTYDKINYVVRCVDNANNWSAKCDIRYSPNTTLTDKHGTLFTSGGRHAITTLSGRPKPTNPVTNGIPKLKTELPDGLITGGLSADQIIKYNAEEIGHIHRAENLRSSILSRYPIDSANPTANLSFMSTLSVSAIFKIPGRAKNPITTFPKNTLIFYYGAETLEAQYFTDVYTHVNGAKNVGNLSVPLSLMPGENFACRHTGIQNYSASVGTNTMIISLTSNTAGQHNHINFATAKGFAAKTAGNFDITPPGGSTEQPTTHTHETTYSLDVQLKSKSLKTYLTKSNLSPIVDGVIIGYTLGKYSKYKGNITDGANMLPPDWYFCDGTNGTPDLRGYYPFTNFEDAPSSGTTLNESNFITVNSINVETIPWIHDHVISQIKGFNGNPGFADQGSHTSKYSPSATTHNHGIDTGPDFFDPPVGRPNAIRRFNVRPNDTIEYSPPTVDIAFIMYKAP